MTLERIFLHLNDVIMVFFWPLAVARQQPQFFFNISFNSKKQKRLEALKLKCPDSRLPGICSHPDFCLVYSSQLSTYNDWPQYSEYQ